MSVFTKAQSQATKTRATKTRETMEELRLNVAKIGIHATERVLLALIDKAYTYQQTVDQLLLNSLVAENQDGAEKIEKVLLRQLDVTEKMLEQAFKMIERLVVRQQDMDMKYRMFRNDGIEFDDEDEDDSVESRYSA